MAPDEASPRAATPWIWLVVASSAVYSFFVLVRPAWGLTFVMDDWENLYRVRAGTWPARYFAGQMEHWSPIFWIVFDVRDHLFGLDHDLYLLSNWAVHVLDVALLAHLLRARTGSEPAGALAAAAFGLSTHAREVLWWSSCSSFGTCLAVMLLGFWMLERHRHGGRLAPVALAAFLAPMCMGPGLALGPGLVVEAALVLPRERRARSVLVIGLAWLAYVALFFLAVPRGRPNFFPRDGSELLLALRFMADMLGTGMLGGLFLAPMGSAPRSLAPALLYAVMVMAGLVLLDRDARRRIVGSHVQLGAYACMLGLTRWSFGPEQATSSRYQYCAVIAWTTLLALGLAPIWRRSPRTTAGVATLLLAALALGHAQAARADRGPYSPAVRAAHPEVIAHLRSAVLGAKAPVFDAGVPYPLAQASTRVAHMAWILAPGNTTVFTNARTPETVEPFLTDPVLRELPWRP